MVIFNTTYHVSNSSNKAFLSFVKEFVIPQALESKLLSKPRLAQVIHPTPEGGISYSLQFNAPNMAAIEQWRLQYEANLSHLIAKQFGHQVAGFSTLLQNITV